MSEYLVYQNESFTIKQSIDKRNNENLPWKNELKNMQKIPIKIVFFHSDMAISKSDYTIFNKELPAIKNTLNSYFGVDVELIKEISKRMNFTPEIMQPSDDMAYGFREPDGKFNGALGDVIYKRTEFTMNNFFVKDYETRLLEFSSSIFDDKLCIIVRTADLIPKSLSLFRSFSPWVWIAMCLTGILASIAYYFLLEFLYLLKFKTLKEKGNQKSFLAPFRIVGILLSCPATNIGHSSQERLFVAMCLLWSLNLSGAFQGSLVDVYTIPKSYSNIDTLKSLDESGLPIAVRHQGLIVDLFGTDKSGESLVMENLKRKIIPTLDDELNVRVAHIGDVAGLERLATSGSQLIRYIRKDGVFLLHFVKECPKSYTLSYVFPKSSVFLDEFNYHINNFVAFGFVNKWYKDTLYVLALEGNIKKRSFVESHKVSLTLEHLQLAFIILGIGVFVGILCFIFELKR